MNDESNGTPAQGVRRLLIASNRLPLQLRRNRDGGWERKSSSGGLVTALEPVLEAEGGTWVGWPGILEEDASLDEVREALDSSEQAYAVEPVPLTGRERRQFYLGFSNEILWPLCHGLPGRCNFEPRYWDVYRRVNRKFARTIARVADPETFLWVHDYHLMAVAEELRALGVENRAGFFLHIPFPAPDIFEQLPWAQEVLESLLHFELVGFQTERDVQNFLDCVETTPALDVTVQGDRVHHSDARATRVGAFPISIDMARFHDGARTDDVAERSRQLREEIGTDHVILGVDRLDYTKGIPQKLEGLERALELYPDLRGHMTLVQLVVPSREKIPEYDRMRKRIEGMVGRINGRFTTRGWAPILYQFGRWDTSELLAFYRAADVALVTPLRDGMNLVSKEFCAASVDGRGVLVLSSFAGSADELESGALLVNPNDVDAVAEAIHRACTMRQEERRSRMDDLQRRVRERDVHWWVGRFLSMAREEPAEDAEVGSGSDAEEPAGREDATAHPERTDDPRGSAPDPAHPADDGASGRGKHMTPASSNVPVEGGPVRRPWPERWRRRIRYARRRSAST